jgi:hypothetical protein
MVAKTNADHQRAYKARQKDPATRLMGSRLDIVVSALSKRRLEHIAQHLAETQKWVLESMIAKAYAETFEEQP